MPGWRLAGLIAICCLASACSLLISPSTTAEDGSVDGSGPADAGLDRPPPVDGSADAVVNDLAADAINDLAADVEAGVIVWSADHEQGTIAQWSPGGGFNQTNGSYEVVDWTAHGGTYSVALTIDTTQAGTSWAARLRRSEGLPATAYYSVWFYIPTGVKPAVWSDIFGWNSTDGSTNNVIYYVGLDPTASDGLQLVLRYRPGGGSAETHRQDSGALIPVPHDRWFHLEAYYNQDDGAGGQVIVWQDGAKIFDISGKPTVITGETLSWSVCLFTGEAMQPDQPTILIDDAAISVGGPVGR